ncbi:MAG TPA: DoxX family protein [Pseudonocardiaceae bacterium]
MIIRRLARVLLAAVFVFTGIDTLRNPDPRVKRATPFIDETVETFKDKLPEGVPTDPATVIRIDAAIKVAAGLALAFGPFPRLAALVLTGSMLPTTVAGHAFWEEEDPAVRGGQQIQFAKNVGLIGGLLLAVTEPRRKRPAKRADKGTAPRPTIKAVKASPIKPRTAA